MTEREEYELVAKACGIKILMWVEDRPQIDFQGVGLRCWNPKHDDGDAFRLAVKLKMTVLADPAIDGSIAAQIDPPHSLNSIWADELAEPDPYAATRLAIWRAAVEYAKSLEK